MGTQMLRKRWQACCGSCERREAALASHFQRRNGEAALRSVDFSTAARWVAALRNNER